VEGMRIYDLYHNQVLKACLRVQDDGQKAWDFSPDPEWQGFWLHKADRSDIEQAIERYPNQETFLMKGFTIECRHS
jgi:hypothetical protein